MMKRREQQGVALVVTLILLAVITMIVVAFLAVSQRNRGLTSTATDQINSQFMADAGLERAQAEVAARLLSQPDLAPVQMLVSTNYIRWAGFDPSLLPADRFFNVSYTKSGLDDLNQPAVGLGPIYDPTFGVPLAYNELMEVLTNLYYNPRPPVYVRTNVSPIFNPEFRFYLDLNRNGRFDSTGNQFVLDDLLAPIGRANLMGDPEWIGVLAHSDVPHSATNRFVGRYAYLVVPEGLTLDLNAAHNYAKAYTPGGTPAVNMVGGDRFLRNMGVGTYELNLASFLVGLNTNAWPGWRQTGNPLLDYSYNWGPPAAVNGGLAFNDAWGLLRYRYRSDPRSDGSASLNNLLTYEDLLGVNAGVRAGTNRVDEYANGPLPVGLLGKAAEDLLVTESGGDDPTGAAWSGAPNPNRFQSLDELFDGAKVPEMVAGQGSLGFKLSRLSSSNSTYNSGTFYRLLSQLGTESGAEPDSFVPGLGVNAFVATHSRPIQPYQPIDRINLNYDNRDLRNVTNLAAADRKAWKAAELKPWEPLAFFTNAAARMLRSQAFIGSDSRVIGLTNIMVWPTNNYDGAVHRVLQVAANLFDTVNTNNMELMTGVTEPKLPTVFRPYLRKEIFTDRFGVGHTNIYIAGYQLQAALAISPSNFVNRLNYWDLNTSNVVDVPTSQELIDTPTRSTQPLALGVPMVVGAKKGFPNFNEIAMDTYIQVQRSLTLRRPSTTALPNQTNEHYFLGVSNVVAVEAWNSYGKAFPRDLVIAVEVDYDLSLLGTNAAQTSPVLRPMRDQINRPYITTNFASGAIDIPAVGQSAWGGRGSATAFKIPLATNFPSLPNSSWRPTGPGFTKFQTATGTLFTASVLTPNRFYAPDWNLALTNRIRFVVMDKETRRIVDYVNLDRMTWSTNVIEALRLADDGGRQSVFARLFNMNRVGGGLPYATPTEGTFMQMQVSLGYDTVDSKYWQNYNSVSRPTSDKNLAVDAFRRFAGGLPPLFYPGQNNPIDPTGLIAQSPFSPAAVLRLKRAYQVNDPLVHYTGYDIAPPTGTLTPELLPANAARSFSGKPENIGVQNKRYQPWALGDDPVATNPIYIDPLITSSDDWNFPDHKLPSVGWIGRVHRGTPWQTVYLKATNSAAYDANGVRSVGGNALSFENWYNSQRTRGTFNEYGLPNYATPDRDWKFLELFTTAPSASATRGKVSVNQTGEASWSAVLGGVQVLTNRTGNLGGMNVSGSSGGAVIEPGTAAMRRLIDGINFTRSAAPYNGQFRFLGDLLSVPELSLSSPYLNRLGSGREIEENLSDAALERIPQQILSLLRLGEPRVVVYAFGQSLKPAPFSINLDPDYLNVVTNYQVTGEYATRSVVQFERVPPDPNFLNLTNQSRLRAVVIESKVLPPQ